MQSVCIAVLNVLAVAVWPTCLECTPYHKLWYKMFQECSSASGYEPVREQANAEALTDLRRAAKAAPSDRGIRAELETAKQRVSEATAKQKAAYARMLKPMSKQPDAKEGAALTSMSFRRDSLSALCIVSRCT